VNRDEQEPGRDDGGHATAEAVHAVHQVRRVAAPDDDRDHEQPADRQTNSRKRPGWRTCRNERQRFVQERQCHVEHRAGGVLPTPSAHMNSAAIT
jgi:hypothetical protein